MELKDIKREMYRIVAYDECNEGYMYSAEDRVAAAQAIALLEIAESLKANRKET